MLDDIQRRIRNSPKYTIDKIKSIKNTPQYTYLNSLGIGFWAFVLITSFLGLVFLFYVESVIKIMVSGYGYLGIFIMVLLIELLLQPTGPDLILILGLVANLNPWIVLILVIGASHLSLYLAYIIGKSIGAAGIERMTGKKTFEKITAKTSSGGKWFMLLSSFTPIPFVPYLSGLWNFTLKDNILYIIIPRTIRLIIVFILTYYLGVQLLDLSIGNINLT